MTDRLTFRSSGGYLRLISDGDKMTIVTEDEKGKIGLMIDSPVIKASNLEIRRPLIEVTRFGSEYREYVPAPTEFTLDLSLTGNRIEYISGRLDPNIFKEENIRRFVDEVNQKMQDPSIPLKRAIEF